MSDLIERLGPKYYKCWMLETRKEAADEIERLHEAMQEMRDRYSAKCARVEALERSQEYWRNEALAATEQEGET